MWDADASYTGLTDAHGHIMQYGRSLTQVSLHGASSIPEVTQRITAFIKKLPAEKKKDYSRVIEGGGFDQTKYPGKAFPTAADLNVPELKDRKIFLLRGKLKPQSGHCLFSCVILTCTYSRYPRLLGFACPPGHSEYPR